MLGVTVADLHDIVHSPFLPTFCEQEKRENKDNEDGHEGNYEDTDNNQAEECGTESEGEEKHGDKCTTVRAGASRAELAISEEEIDDCVDGTRDVAKSEFAKLKVSAEVHIGEERALPVVVLNLDYVVHDKPGPNVKVPVIDTLEDETYHLEANQHNAEHRLVLL